MGTLTSHGGYRISRRSALISFGATFAAFSLERYSGAQSATPADALPSWNDRPAKQAVLDFVRVTTDRSSKEFVAKNDRTRQAGRAAPSAALAITGVRAVITAKDLGAVPRIPLRLLPLPGTERFLQPVITADRVRYVGEPVAVVVGDSPALPWRRERAAGAAD